jgi:hypothetical protein
MKLLISLFVLLLLQSCTTQVARQQQLIKPGNIPAEWQAIGRVGVIIDDKVQNLSFMVNFNDQSFDLTLTGALGLGQVSIVSNINELRINGDKSHLNLQQWMERTLGWYFPLEKLPNIVFKHQLKVSNVWQIEISKFRLFKESSVAKMIKLHHHDKSIRVKLLLQEITTIPQSSQVKITEKFTKSA